MALKGAHKGGKHTMTSRSFYYAVIFSSTKRNLDEEARHAYKETAERMIELASSISGYIGVEGAYQTDGFGITVSYWENEEAIKKWRDHGEHEHARNRGKSEWYQNYSLRVAKVERTYEWNLQEINE